MVDKATTETRFKYITSVDKTTLVVDETVSLSSVYDIITAQTVGWTPRSANTGVLYVQTKAANTTVPSQASETTVHVSATISMAIPLTTAAISTLTSQRAIYA